MKKIILLGMLLVLGACADGFKESKKNKTDNTNPAKSKNTQQIKRKYTSAGIECRVSVDRTYKSEKIGVLKSQVYFLWNLMEDASPQIEVQGSDEIVGGFVFAIHMDLKVEPRFNGRVIETLGEQVITYEYKNSLKLTGPLKLFIKFSNAVAPLTIESDNSRVSFYENKEVFVRSAKTAAIEEKDGKSAIYDFEVVCSLETILKNKYKDDNKVLH